MEKELSLSEKKRFEKDILDYVVSICRKYNITYFLGYGTLLGAIRHKGFIPWDDDIDLVLLRKDYDRLVECLAKENHPRYQVLYPERGDYYYPFAKVVDTYTLVEEKNLSTLHQMGLWVDLFPLDELNDADQSRVKQLKLLDKCRAAAITDTFPEKYGKSFYLPWRICRLVGYKFFLSLELKKLKMSKPGNRDLVTYLPGSVKHYLPKQIFDSIIQVEFEGDMYNSPADYDTYLRLNYGNYMELPPEESRKVHDMKAILIKK